LYVTTIEQFDVAAVLADAVALELRVSGVVTESVTVFVGTVVGGGVGIGVGVAG
jgi:hypothetical protein